MLDDAAVGAMVTSDGRAGRKDPELIAESAHLPDPHRSGGRGRRVPSRLLQEQGPDTPGAARRRLAKPGQIRLEPFVVAFRLGSVNRACVAANRGTGVVIP